MSDSRKLSFFTTITMAILTAIAIPSPARAADLIVARLPPFKDFKISTAELKTFANTGKLPAQFADFTKSNSSAQLQEFRQLLQQRFKISPLYVSQFTHAPLVEKRNLQQLNFQQVGLIGVLISSQLITLVDQHFYIHKLYFLDR
jgi:hypothetical protein